MSNKAQRPTKPSYHSVSLCLRGSIDWARARTKIEDILTQKSTRLRRWELLALINLY